MYLKSSCIARVLFSIATFLRLFGTSFPYASVFASATLLRPSYAFNSEFSTVKQY